jgi:hypothetical protein
MDGDTRGVTFSLLLKFNTYMFKSIAHLMQPCDCQECLEIKLFESQGHNIQLQLQLHEMHSCFEEVDDKCTKAKCTTIFSSLSEFLLLP